MKAAFSIVSLSISLFFLLYILFDYIGLYVDTYITYGTACMVTWKYFNYCTV